MCIAVFWCPPRKSTSRSPSTAAARTGRCTERNRSAFGEALFVPRDSVSRPNQHGRIGNAFALLITAAVCPRRDAPKYRRCCGILQVRDSASRADHVTANHGSRQFMFARSTKYRDLDRLPWVRDHADSAVRKMNSASARREAVAAGRRSLGNPRCTPSLEGTTRTTRAHLIDARLADAGA